MARRVAKWLSGFVVLVMLAVAVPQTASAQTLPTVTITEDTVLTADLNARIVIGANGITLDGAGHAITGDGTGIGIDLTGRKGVTVMNCRVSWFVIGVCLDSSHDNTIANNTVSPNADGTGGTIPPFYYSGILLKWSHRNTLTYNSISDCPKGVMLHYSDHNTLTNNTADGNGIMWPSTYGIILSGSGNILTGNLAIGNYRGFVLGGNHNKLLDNMARDNRHGFYLENALHNTLTGNTANNSLLGFVLDSWLVCYNKFLRNVAYDNMWDVFFKMDLGYVRIHNKFVDNMFTTWGYDWNYPGNF